MSLHLSLLIPRHSPAGAGEPVEMDPEVHGEPNEEELRGQVDARLAEMERVATTVLRDA